MTEWIDEPITRADVETAVARWFGAPAAVDEGFVEHNIKQWEGVLWRDAGAWNLATEWAAYLASREE